MAKVEATQRLLLLSASCANELRAQLASLCLVSGGLLIARVVDPSRPVRAWTRLKGKQRGAQRIAGKRSAAVGRRQSCWKNSDIPMKTRAGESSSLWRKAMMGQA